MTITGTNFLGASAVVFDRGALTQPHSGSYSAQLQWSSTTHDAGGFSWISQSVSVPSGSPTLSFWYRMFCNDGTSYDNLSVQVLAANAPPATVWGPSCDDVTQQVWTNATVDLSSYAGQAVTLWFGMRGDYFSSPDTSFVFLDDISLPGSGLSNGGFESGLSGWSAGAANAYGTYEPGYFAPRIASSFTVSSDGTQISAVTPPGLAGGYPVKVLNIHSNWISSVSGPTFTYTGTSTQPAAALVFTQIQGPYVSSGGGTSPGSLRSMSPFGLAIQAVDAAGNATTNFTGPVTFSSSDSDSAVASALSAESYTFQASDNGVHSFSLLKLRTPGLQTLTASSPGVTSATWTVFVAPAYYSAAGPATATAGGAINNILYTARDYNESALCGFTTTVHFTSSDTNAHVVLPSGTQPFNSSCSSNNGAVAYSATLFTSGTQTVTLTDATGAYGAYTVTVGAAGLQSYRLSALVGTLTAGLTTSSAFRLDGLDQYGNVEPAGTATPAGETFTFSGVPAISSNVSPCASNGNGLLYPNGYDGTIPVGGNVTVSAVPMLLTAAFCKSAPTFIVGGTLTSTVNLDTSAASVNVIPAGPGGSIVATPGSITPSTNGGGTFTVTVSGPSGAPITDSWGNQVLSALSISTSLMAVGNCTSAASSFTPGTANLSGGIYTASIQQNWVTPSGDSSFAPQATTYNVSVGTATTTFQIQPSAGSASRYAIISQSTGTPAGSANSIQAYAVDADCNPVTNYHPASVTVTSSDPAYRHGTPGGSPAPVVISPTFTNGGFATTQEYLFTTGNQTFTINDGTLPAATSPAYNVLALSLSAQASPSVVGAYGHGISLITATATGGGSTPAVGHTITIGSLTPSPAGACGTLGPVSNGGFTDSGGQATAQYTSSTTTGVCTMTITDMNTGTSTNLTIRQAPLTVTVSVSPAPVVSPSPGTAGTVFVTVIDPSNQPVQGDTVRITPSGVCGAITGSTTTDSSGKVTLAIQPGSSGSCTLNATETQGGASGSATFTE